MRQSDWCEIHTLNDLIGASNIKKQTQKNKKKKEEQKKKFFFPVFQRVYFHQKLNQNRVNRKTFSSFFLPRETLTKRSCPKASLDEQWPLGRLPSHPSPDPKSYLSQLLSGLHPQTKYSKQCRQ